VVDTVTRQVELEVARLIVDTVNLEDVAPDSIDPSAPLFVEGLGLDSIDALEIALAVSLRYGIELRAEDTDTKRVFGSLRALAQHIEEHRAK
jgi:acyl carrier protein